MTTRDINTEADRLERALQIVASLVPEIPMIMVVADGRNSNQWRISTNMVSDEDAIGALRAAVASYDTPKDKRVPRPDRIGGA